MSSNVDKPTAASSDSQTNEVASVEGESKSGDRPSERRAAAVASRDIPISTLVHLLNLPTASQMSLLEGKVDVLTGKISAVLSRLERVSSELEVVKNDATVDRIDFQLAEIRSLLKKVLGGTPGGEQADKKSERPKTEKAKPKVLSSDDTPAAGSEKAAAAEKKPETKIIEEDALAELSEPQTDEAFQNAEAARVRLSNKEV